MKKSNWYYEIEWREFRSIEDIAIFYWFTLKDFNKKMRAWETIDSILWFSWYAEEVITDKERKYINSLNLIQLFDYKDIFKRLSNREREYIRRKLMKWWDAYLIYTNSEMNLVDIKEYIFTYKCKEVIDWQKHCLQCRQFKDLNKFWTNKWIHEAICADCMNFVRNDKMQNDIIFRKKTLEEKKRCIPKKKKTRAEMTEEEIRIDSEKHAIAYRKKADKKAINKVIKHRLLTNK